MICAHVDNSIGFEFPMTTSDEVALSQYMRQVRHEVDELLANVATYGEGCPRVLEDAIRHILLAPGKRCLLYTSPSPRD